VSYLEAVGRSNKANPRDDTLRNHLSVLMAVREPLSLAQLKQFGFNDAGELLRYHTGFMFHVGDDFKVYAFHKSVFDFLASERIDSSGDNGNWRRLTKKAVSVEDGHKIAFERLSEELSRGDEREPSEYCLRHVVLYGREIRCNLDSVEGDLEFWAADVRKGIAQDYALLDLLNIPMGDRNKQVDDAARFMSKHIQELASLPPNKVRQRLLVCAREAPTSTSFPEAARQKKSDRMAIGAARS
jgi:hypothetical protein